MKAHHRKRLEEKRAVAERNDPIVQQRREEKRQARQAKHAERMARKKERDRLWHEKHKLDLDPAHRLPGDVSLH